MPSFLIPIPIGRLASRTAYWNYFCSRKPFMATDVTLAYLAFYKNHDNGIY